MTDLSEALRALNSAAYDAIKAGRDTTQYPNLNRKMLRDIAASTDKMVDSPMIPVK